MVAVIEKDAPRSMPGCHLDSAEGIMRSIDRAMPHLDAGESLFFARQLEYIVPTLYEVKYAPLKARTHFPVDFTGGNGIKEITYRAVDRRGKAKIVTNWSTDFPRVNILAKEVTNKVVSLGDSYGYDFQEIRYAQQANMQLETQEANAARLAIAELENQLAYVGDPNSNVYGMLNNQLVPISYAAYPINNTTSIDNIVAVFASAILGVFTTSKGIENVNMILVPLTLWTYITTTRLGTNNDSTLMEYLNKAFPGVVFDWCNECSGSGPNGSDIMFAYVRNERNLTLTIPSEFEQLPMFSDGATFSVKCHERFAGLRVFYPASAQVTVLQ